MKKTIKTIEGVKVLSIEEQRKIMGGMKWNGLGSRNVQDMRPGREMNNTLFSWYQPERI
ncbi:hypothetical protein [Pedobacter changchengzhani]|uniref:hypothetical protein n=1 Tax=Pedobacter changchengzhani TaxID=2529274 RepID=UPI00140559B2|nr:hypothetical protein [Pedobacter changchengzhani]